jgi:hypothetical protein
MKQLLDLRPEIRKLLRFRLRRLTANGKKVSPKKFIGTNPKNRPRGLKREKSFSTKKSKARTCMPL